jgi:hypothetical protein
MGELGWDLSHGLDFGRIRLVESVGYEMSGLVSWAPTGWARPVRGARSSARFVVWKRRGLGYQQGLYGRDQVSGLSRGFGETRNDSACQMGRLLAGLVLGLSNRKGHGVVSSGLVVGVQRDWICQEG